MIIGIPREIKIGERRVALTPVEVGELVRGGNAVVIEKGAGAGCGFGDEAYKGAGASIAQRKRSLYAEARLIVKVKEPEGPDLLYLSSGHLVLCFLHLAAHPGLLRTLLRKKVAALALESIESDTGAFPCLQAMSEIAGKVAVQLGAFHLGTDRGGAGILLGGAGPINPAEVLVLGAGTVGRNAAAMARGFGARLFIYDRNEEKADEVAGWYGGQKVAFNPQALAQAVARADLLVGAVLVPGRRAPKVVTRGMVAAMRRGSVIVDVAIDQGGCVETSRVTTLKRPAIVRYGVIHVGVPNLPSVVARTATQVLARSVFPFVRALADLGLDAAAGREPALARAIHLRDGRVVHPALEGPAQF